MVFDSPHADEADGHDLIAAMYNRGTAAWRAVILVWVDGEVGDFNEAVSPVPVEPEHRQVGMVVPYHCHRIDPGPNDWTGVAQEVGRCLCVKRLADAAGAARLAVDAARASRVTVVQRRDVPEVLDRVIAYFACSACRAFRYAVRTSRHVAEPVRLEAESGRVSAAEVVGFRKM